jgi:putative RNA 2'-phosphotransferase
MKSPPKAILKTAKFIAYVLGRRPDEFGLIPDPDGFVTTKELLKALHEESGWRHIRAAHLNELLISIRPAPIEIQGNRIRASDRSGLPSIIESGALPKLLYIAIRSKAYAAVTEKGIRAGGNSHLVLSSDKAMALRIGTRKDHHPVLLSVEVEKTRQHHIVYYQYGNHLFLTDAIPAGTFSGPALPKPKPVAAKITDDAPSKAPPSEPTPGSYIVEFGDPEDLKKTARQRRQKQKERQKARRHARQQKRDRYD